MTHAEQLVDDAARFLVCLLLFFAESGHVRVQLEVLGERPAHRDLIRVEMTFTKKCGISVGLFKQRKCPP